MRRFWISLLLPFAGTAAHADLFLSGFSSQGVYRYDEASGLPVGTGVFIASNSGGLSLPHGVMRMPDGSFIVASAGNDRVLRYASDGSFLGTFIDNGVNGVPAGTLDYPVDFAVDSSGLLYVTSQLNDRVVRFDATTGAFHDIFISGGALDGPSGVALHANGDVYVVGRFSGNVLRYNGVTGAPVGSFAPTFLFNTPFGVAIHPTTSELYVANGSSNQIVRLNPTTGATAGPVSGGGINTPIGVEFGPGSDLYVASFSGNTVARFDGLTGASEGNLIAPGSGGVQGPNFFTFAVPEPTTAGGAAIAFAMLMSGRGRKVRRG